MTALPVTRQQTRKRSQNQAGYTLLEVMVATSLASLLLLGGMDLLLSSVRAASQSGAQISATTRATVTIARIMDISRECYALTLPTATSGFVPPVPGTTAASYVTADGSAAALQLTAPATSAVTVNDSNGNPQTAGTNFAMTYTQATGPTLTIYRSDASGNPAPNVGQYLWEQGTPPGLPALPPGGQALAKLGETPAISAGIPDEATFVRPATAVATVPAVEIHVIAADYSAVKNSQSSESATNQLVGKCVVLRNHP